MKLLEQNFMSKKDSFEFTSFSPEEKFDLRKKISTVLNEFFFLSYLNQKVNS